MKRQLLISFIVFILFWVNAFGQQTSPDFLRSTGKIYVVIAVIAAVFIGIVLFLIYLDRKLTKLENQINEKD